MKRAVIIILLVTGWKLVNLTATPMFGDESVYCWWGYQTANLGVSQAWGEMVNQKRIAPMVSLIQGVGFAIFPQAAPISLCRGVSVMAASLTGLILFIWLKSWPALIFWLLNPFNFFNDRTSLQEPVLNLFIVMLVVSMQSKQLVKVGLFLTLAFLTKLTTLMLVPGLVIWAIWQRKMAVAGVIVLVTIAFRWWAVTFTHLWDIFGYHTYADWSVGNLVSRAIINLRLTMSWYQQYLTYGFWVLAGLGIWQSLRRRQWQGLIILIPLLSGYVLLADSYFPRLLLVTLPFWAIILSYATKTKMGWVIFGLILIVWIKNDVAIVWHPESAGIAKEDYFQFYQDWTSGKTVRQAVMNWQNQPELRVVKIPKDMEATWRIYKLELAKEKPIELVIE